jgi:hypothetical protein
MALDKKFLKYKLEKIKNDRIFKDQDTETKKIIRKENAKLAAEEADAIHSYLTGEDNIDKLDNKSYMENRLPGSLFLTPKRITKGKKREWIGGLNIRQVQSNPKTKKTRLSKLLKKFRTIAKSNIESARQIIILKKIFDKLNITFSRDEIKFDGKIQAGGYQSSDGQEGITEDYIVTDVIIEEVDGVDQTRYVRKRIIVKDGLIVDQQIIS